MKWFLLGFAGFYVVVGVFVVALCKAAAVTDETMWHE